MPEPNHLPGVLVGGFRLAQSWFEENLTLALVGLGLLVLGLLIGAGLAYLFQPRPVTDDELHQQIQALRNAQEVQRRKWEALPNLLASLASVEDPDQLHRSIAFVTREHLGAEYSALLLQQGEDFVIQAAEGLSERTARDLRLSSKEGLVRYIQETNWPVHLGARDRQMSLFRRFPEVIEEVLIAPLRTGGDVFGLLWVANKTLGGGFERFDLHLLQILAVPFSLAIHNARRFAASQSTVTRTLVEVARQIEERDPYTRGHSARVSEICSRVARAMKLSTPEIEVLRTAARLHDLGNLAIPREVWEKPGPLNDEEKELVRSHPQRAVDLLKPLGYLDRALPLILYHHEHYDGSGYPFGIRGTSIPVGAALIGMAEAFDAMVCDRPHRPALPLPEVLRLMAEGSGTRYDPRLLKIFLQTVEKELSKAGR